MKRIAADWGGALKSQPFAFSRFVKWCAPIALAAVWLSGCLQTTSDVASKDPPNAYDAVRSADLQPRFPTTTRNSDTSGAPRGPVSYVGAPVEAVVTTPPISDG